MKVLKTGSKNHRTRKAICRNCRSRIEAMDDELQWEAPDPRGEGPLARARCPHCEVEIYFYK